MSTRGGEGVKNGQNLVHVVVECPLIHEQISCYMAYENKVNEGTEFPHFFSNSLKYKFYNENLFQQIFI